MVPTTNSILTLFFQINRQWAIWFSHRPLHSLRYNFISSLPQCNLILRFYHVDCQIHQRNHQSLFFSSYLSIESRSMSPNLSVVIEFLGNVIFIFEKLLSHEALVTGRVTAISNNETQLLSSCKWKILFERYKQPRLLPKQIICQSYFMFQIIFTKWIWLADYFKCVSDRNVWPPGKELKYAKEFLLYHYRKYLQNSMRLQDMCA